MLVCNLDSSQIFSNGSHYYPEIRKTISELKGKETVLGKYHVRMASFCLFMCSFIIKTGSHFIALTGLEFTEILLPLPLECWG